MKFKLEYILIISLLIVAGIITHKFISEAYADEKEQVFISETVKCDVEGKIIEYVYPFKLLEFKSVVNQNLNDKESIIKDENGNIMIKYPPEINCGIGWWKLRY